LRKGLPKPVSEISVSRKGENMSPISTSKPDAGTAHRVTINDVADALELTKSTVSRALNGYADISPATQLRVKRMAEKMNYRPLTHAQAIKTGRTRSLGLILQLADHDAHRPFLAEFLAGLSSGASHEGYTLTVASADNEAHMMEMFRSMLRERKADGFVLPRAMVDDPRVRLLRAADVPFVLYGRQADPEGCCWFDMRGEEAMADAVARLAALGHERIGFINGGDVYAYAALRREGFLSGMQGARLTHDPELEAHNVMTREGGEAAGGALLDLDAPPTAIVCAVDQVALGVYRAAADRGLTIGRDLSVIGYDGIQEGAHVHPPLSTFAVDNKAAGERLATLLIRRLRGEAPETLRETAAATWCDRGSIGPRATK